MPAPDGHALHRAGPPGLLQALCIAEGHHRIIDAVHQQHRAAGMRNGVDRRDVIKACANHPLHMPQDIPANHRIRNMKLDQIATHHLIGVRKSAQAHHGTQVHAAGGAQQRGARPHRVANDGQAGAVHCRLALQPVQPGLNVLREPRQGRKRLVITVAMAARIQQQHRVTRRMQRCHGWQHQAGIGAPTVHQQDRRRPGYARNRHKPGEQGFIIRNRQAYGLCLQCQIVRGALVRQARCPQPAQYERMRGGAQQHDQRHAQKHYKKHCHRNAVIPHRV